MSHANSAIPVSNEKQLIVGRTDDGRYVYAIFSSAGFHEYRVVPRNQYREQKIREAAKAHRVKVSGRISWEEWPQGGLIELDKESCRVVRALSS